MGLSAGQRVKIETYNGAFVEGTVVFVVQDNVKIQEDGTGKFFMVHQSRVLEYLPKVVTPPVSQIGRNPG